MLRFLKTFFCRHDYVWHYNLHGDQIISWGYKRSVWRCTKCGLLQGRDELHKAEHDGNLAGVAGPLPDRGWD